MTDTPATEAGTPIVTNEQIGSIAEAVDAESGYFARTGDTAIMGMMIVAMKRLQKIYETKLAEYQATFEWYIKTGEEVDDRLMEKDKRIASLEAELSAAREWVLVENGEYTMQGFSPGYTYTLRVDGADLEAWSNDHSNLNQDGSPRHVEEISIDEWRVCRLVDTPVSVPSDEVREAITKMIVYCKRRNLDFGVGEAAIFVEAWLASVTPKEGSDG